MTAWPKKKVNLERSEERGIPPTVPVSRTMDLLDHCMSFVPTVTASTSTPQNPNLLIFLRLTTDVGSNRRGFRPPTVISPSFLLSAERGMR